MTAKEKLRHVVDDVSEREAEAALAAIKTLELDTDAFWRERGMDDLAREQGVVEYSLPMQIDSDLWRDDDEAAALIQAIRSFDR